MLSFCFTRSEASSSVDTPQLLHNSLLLVQLNLICCLKSTNVLEARHERAAGMKISGLTRKTFLSILVLYCCALAVFQYSFFSSRRHLSARSSATIDSSTRSTLLAPTHTRVFLFIVDALRLDFVIGTKYAASFPHLHDLLATMHLRVVYTTFGPILLLLHHSAWLQSLRELSPPL